MYRIELTCVENIFSFSKIYIYNEPNANSVKTTNYINKKIELNYSRSESLMELPRSPFLRARTFSYDHLFNVDFKSDWTTRKKKVDYSSNIR